MKELSVIISGGFFLAYQAALPEFERESGLAVTTLSGASQGTGPKTIRYQLESGTPIDVVIMSKEGLEELIARDLILPGSEVALASVPLAVAVRQGSPKPERGRGTHRLSRLRPHDAGDPALRHGARGRSPRHLAESAWRLPLRPRQGDCM